MLLQNVLNGHADINKEACDVVHGIPGVTGIISGLHWVYSINRHKIECNIRTNQMDHLKLRGILYTEL